MVLGLLSPAIAVRRGMERLEAKRRSTLALLSFLYFLALLARHLKGLPVVKPRGAGPRRFRARGILLRTALNLGKTAGPPSR